VTSANRRATEGLMPRPAGYAEWLTDLKARIHIAQQRASLAVNRELLPASGELLTVRDTPGFGDDRKQPPHYLNYFHGGLVVDETWSRRRNA